MKRFFPEMSRRLSLFRESLRRYLVENPGLKLLAALITLVLWLSVSRQPVSETTLRLPITFQNVPPSLSVVDQDTDTVEVKIKGPNDMLSRIRSGSVHLDTVVDLSSYANRPGKRVITLSDENVSVPASVVTQDVKPARLSITLAPLIEKTVPIQPTFDGAPVAGLVLSGFSIFPNTILLKGPQTRVDQIDVARTETILLTNRGSDFDTLVAVDVRDPSIEIMQPSVKVHVTLARATNQIIFDNLALKLIPGDRKIIAQPAVVRVTLEGEQNAIKSLTPNDISVWVDTTQVSPDGSAPVQVQFLTSPQDINTGIRVKQVEPERVTIKSR